MSNLTKNVSPEDKKMLNSIFLRSFSVFASCAGGSVKAGRRLAVLRPARA